MRNKHFSALISCVIWFILCDTAFSDGIININIQTDIEVKKNVIEGSLQVDNIGNVTAHNVNADILILGSQIETKKVKYLYKDRQETFYFKMPLGNIKKGSYPVIVVVNFHDSEFFPFTALSCSSFVYGNKVNRKDIICVSDDITMTQRGVVKFLLKNSGSIHRELKASFIIPKAFSSSHHAKNISIGPGMEETTNFQIANVMAMPGSNYTVFCVFEYDDPDDSHHTVISDVTVQIKKRTNWLSQTRWYWLYGGVMFIVLAIFIQCEKHIKQ